MQVASTKVHTAVQQQVKHQEVLQAREKVSSEEQQGTQTMAEAVAGFLEVK